MGHGNSFNGSGGMEIHILFCHVVYTMILYIGKIF